MEEQPISEKQELIEEVVGFNFRKLWFTFKELTVRPGETIAAYCDGIRAKYVSPITYFLLTYGLNFFVTHLFVKNDDLAKSFEEGYKLGNPSATNEKFQSLMAFIKPGFEFLQTKEGMVLSYIPILIILQWLFYRKYRKSFFHSFYFCLYVAAQTNLLTIPLIMTLGWSTPAKVLLVTTSLLSVAFYFYAIPKFYLGITVSQIALRTFGQIIAFIIPFFIWAIFLVLISAFIIQKLIS